ncbi:hypothetical protein [Pectobacterium versatile]|uniref:hypothetical protein n=1 Tax=Pectobacterium versatile TaxID=2488639 RepID=UPI003827D13E
MLTIEYLIESLEEMGEILRLGRFIEDDSPFRNARTQLSRNPKKYVIPYVNFKVARGNYVRGGVWDKDLEIKMQAEIEVNNTFSFNDASRMIVNIEYSCLTTNGDKECKGSWHMDYHVQEGKPEYMHPDFHFHHGGRNISDLDDYGSLVILDNPRIMHHPLDIFLAIDFIISNFYPEIEWRKIRADTRYTKIVKMAQLAWWKPFYTNLYKYWEHCDAKDSILSKQEVEKAQRLNPHFI